MAVPKHENLLLTLPHEEVLLNGEPYYKQVFESIKGDIEAMSEQLAIITDIGKMTDLLPAAKFEGKISVSKRLSSGEATPEGIAQAKKYVPKCYVPVTAGANIRCVDGRGEEGYDDAEPSWYVLGPQVQGGIFDIAVAKRLATGVKAGEQPSIKADIEEIVEAGSAAFAPAVHTDDHPHADGQCGCGAINSQETKLDYYLDLEIAAGIPGVVAAIYELAGKPFDPGTLSDLSRNAAAPGSIKQAYFGNKPDVFEYLSDINKNAKKVVTGTHNEFELILNFVSGTTLNTGKLNVLTNGEYNAFGLDVWYILANFEDEAPFVLADALATILNLTDGSLDVRARPPNEQYTQAV